MTLSDRLEAARRARLDAVGRLATDTVSARPAPTPSPKEETLDLREKVEVAPTGLHAVNDRPVLDGTAARCPTCRYDARIDLVDLIGHTTHFSCTNCGTLWQVDGLHTTFSRSR
jgi:hypothetical protein